MSTYRFVPLLCSLIALGAAGATALAQPANDSCDHAATATPGVNTFDTTDATNDYSGGCDIGFLPDIWFGYTPASSGSVIVSTCGLVDSSFNTSITVLQGCNGPEIACNSGLCFDGQSAVGFRVAGGVRYLIRISSASLTLPAGQFSMTLQPDSNCVNPLPGAPANDCCSHATPVGAGTFAFDTTHATRDYAGPCDLLGQSPDVWFDYTSPTNGFARVTPDIDAPQDLAIVVLGGSCDGTEIVCDADIHRGRRQAVFPVVAGLHYLVRLSAFTELTASGHVIIGPLDAPVNDECSSAAPIAGAGVFEYDNTLANDSGPDNSLGCSGLGGSAIAHDVWFLWTNTLNAGQDAVISTCGGTFVDTRLAVYAAGCPVDEPIVCNDDDCFLQSRVQFTPAPGAQYLIRVGNWPGFGGNDGPDGEPGTFTIESVTSCILTAPVGALIEPEACGEDINGGCESFSPGWTDIACGRTTIFGTSAVVGGVHDQDFYRITLPVATHLSVSGTAEFRMQIAIFDNECPANTLARTIFPTHPCVDPNDVDVGADVDAGTYTIAVVNTAVDSPCSNKNHYIITVTTGSCTPVGRCCVGSSCQVLSAADCAAEHGAYSGDGTVCPPTLTYQPAACSDAFEDISSVGVQGSSCDDCGDVVDLGFTFSLFNQPRTQVGVSSNGYITFDLNAYLGMSDNQPLPRTASPEYVAPFWDDLRTDSGAGVMYTATLGTAPRRRFIAMWKNVENFDAPGSSSTFEVVLFEGTNTIAFRYRDLDPVATPTAGVSSSDGTAGVNLDQPVSNSCVTLTLANVPSPCGQPADFNHDGLVNSQDFFDFLNAFFSSAPSSDFNHDGLINSQDFFDFLNAFFAA